MAYNQKTFRYNVYLKNAIGSGIRAAFGTHPDPVVKETQVSLEFPLEETTYPYILVKYYESDFRNAGVGHIEFLEFSEIPGKRFPAKHYLYSGHIEFTIFAQTSIDRDIVSDALKELLTMGDMQSYTNNFYKKLYSPSDRSDPFAAENENFVNINTDRVVSTGDTQSPVPWGAEDSLIYITGQRVEIFGELYSRIYDVEEGLDIVENVDVYPYRFPLDPEPVPNPNPEDPAPWS